MKVSKANIDVSKAFLAYMSFQGDCKRTALAMNLTPEEIEELAIQEGWQEKLGNFAALREADSNFQITLNRSLNYVQARQLSALIDGVIQHLSSSPEALIDSLTSCTKNGSTFQVKPLTDLVKAAEVVQLMTSRALGDQGDKMADDKASGGSIALNVANALNAVQANVGLDSVSIVQKSLPGHDSSRTPGASQG